MRCKAVLLKAQGLSSPQIGDRLDMNRTTVNNWVNRFEAEGIKGLATRPGHGRKPIIGTQDGEVIRQVTEKDRSSILSAKAQWEAATGKTACEETLRRFLSALAQDLDYKETSKGQTLAATLPTQAWGAARA